MLPDAASAQRRCGLSQITLETYLHNNTLRYTFDTGNALEVRSAFHVIVLKRHVGAGRTVWASRPMHVRRCQVYREPVLSVCCIGWHQTSVYLLT